MDGSVNGNSAVCDQKISKFFVSHWEESIAGHVGVKSLLKVREGKYKREQVVAGSREQVLLFSRCF
jgi:hypothetical protein